MTVDELKAEARCKPSGVAFRKISQTVYISVKIQQYPGQCINDDYQWKCGEVSIPEHRAIEILKNL